MAFAITIILHVQASDFEIHKNERFAVDNCRCSEPYLAYSRCDPSTFYTNCRSMYGGPCSSTTCERRAGSLSTSSILIITFTIAVTIWIVKFLDGFCEIVTASVFGTYYWTYDKAEVVNIRICRSASGMARYNLGTVALGSWLITLMAWLRLCLESIRENAARDNDICTTILTIVCGVWCSCIEELLKFITKNIYIICAVYGGNFCESGRYVIELLSKSIVKLLGVNIAISIVYQLYTVVIVLAFTAGYYFVIKNITHCPILITVMFAFISFFLVKLFFDTYDMATDTILLCFLDDMHLNDGSEERPYYAQEKLMQIVMESQPVQETPPEPPV